MDRLPLLFRLFTFWIGVLVLVPLLGLWVDSMYFKREVLLSPVPGEQAGVRSSYAAAQVEFISTPMARGGWELLFSKLKIDFSQSSSYPLNFGFRSYRHTLTPYRVGGCWPYTGYVTSAPASTSGPAAMNVEVNRFTLPYWIAVFSFTPPWFLLLSLRMLHRKRAGTTPIVAALVVRRALARAHSF